MGVYKTGYVCWNNEKIIHPDRLFYETRFEKREDHWMNDGMLIKLERFKFKDQKPRIRHASFTVNVSGRLGSRIE